MRKREGEKSGTLGAGGAESFLVLSLRLISLTETDTLSILLSSLILQNSLAQFTRSLREIEKSFLWFWERAPTQLSHSSNTIMSDNSVGGFSSEESSQHVLFVPKHSVFSSHEHGPQSESNGS